MNTASAGMSAPTAPELLRHFRLNLLRTLLLLLLLLPGLAWRGLHASEATQAVGVGTGAKAEAEAEVKTDADAETQPLDPVELSPRAIQTDAEAIAAIKDRAMGSPGALSTIALIENRLLDLGIKTLRVRTTVSIPVEQACTLSVDGMAIEVHPHQPNSAATVQDGGNDLSGHLVFAGSGSLRELAGKDVAGNIVVLDDDAGDTWTHAAGLGAAAVIFRTGPHQDRFHLAKQALGASLSFPRFIANLGPDLDGHTATLHADIRWEPRPAWSLLALIPGRSLNKEAVVLCAGYEANGPIAGLTPGATRAWNAALLLNIAAKLAHAPPDRSIVLIFHGGRAEMMRGLRHLVAAMTLDRDYEGQLELVNRFSTQRGNVLAAATRAGLVAEVLGKVPDGGKTTISLLKEELIRTVATDLTPLSAEETPNLNRFVRSRELLDEVLATAAGEIADTRNDVLQALRARYAQRTTVAFSSKELTELRDQLRVATPASQAWRDLEQRIDNDKALSADENVMLSSTLDAARHLLARHREVVDQRAEDLDSLSAARDMASGLNLIHLIAFDFSDGGRSFSSISGGYYVTWSNELGWMHKALLRLSGGIAGRLPPAYDPAPQQMPFESSSYWPSDYLHEAGEVGAYLPAVTFSTTNDARSKLGTPLDTMQAFRGENFLHQCAGLMPLLRAYIDSPDIAFRHAQRLSFKDSTIRVDTRAIGSTTGRRPFPFPFVATFFGPPGPYVGDVRRWETAWGDVVGEARVRDLPEDIPGFISGLPVEIYGFDGHGAITHALASAGLQATSPDLQISVNWQVRDVLALVFRATPSQLYDVYDPRLLTPLPLVTALSATRKAAPNFAHVEVDQGQAALFSEAGLPLMVTAGEGQIGNRLVLLGSDEHGGWSGRPPGLLSHLTALDAASDMWHLDDQRLQLLRRNGIQTDSLVTLHAYAEASLERARQAIAHHDIATATGAAQASWAYSSRVYPDLLSTANDVVYGLVVLLVFAIPFALISERLLLAGATLSRRLTGFGCCFLAIFGFFYLFHPAFSLATTPMVIFLAFFIIGLSVWTIGLLSARFEQEMENIRMAGLGLHKIDVSRLATLFATLELGISNMRRRPLRTVLTGSCVVLMTFILLTFASFTPSISTQRLDLDRAATYPGIMVRLTGWQPLPEATLEQLHDQWSHDFTLYPLRWLQASASSAKFPLSGPNGPSYVNGVLACLPGDPSGIEQALVRGPLIASSPRGFPAAQDADQDWVFFPEEVLKRVGCPPGGTLLFRGRNVHAGLIEAPLLAAAVLVGGEPVTPLALAAAEAGRQESSTTSASGLLSDTASSNHLTPGGVAVMRADLISSLDGGSTLRAVTLVPHSQAVEVAKSAEVMAQELATTLRVAVDGQAYLLTGVGHLSATGLSTVLVPLLLGGLIIFSTMLNSVAERGRDIFIFASLGLAPVHVAVLFLVEAGIYAVLGGMGGYLVAQGIACLLGFVAHLGYGVQPDLNYSSMTAVITILVVMATVLLSALYPAWMAARAAHPGTSDFTIPQPKGDRIDIPFPFTVARRDIVGLLAFLAHFLELHAESSTASFTSSDAQLQRAGDDCTVTARIWLAPFDLGLSQRFTLHAHATDVPAIYAIAIRLDLLSGQRATWRRANRPFMSQLRRQFLVWRSLTPQAMDEYRALGHDAEAARRVALRKQALLTPLAAVAAPAETPLTLDETSATRAPASASSANPESTTRFEEAR